MEKWVVHSVSSIGLREQIVCKTEAQAETVADILRAHGSDIAQIKLEYGPVRLVSVDRFWAYACLALVIIELLSAIFGYGVLSTLGECTLCFLSAVTGILFVMAFYQVRVPE